MVPQEALCLPPSGLGVSKHWTGFSTGTWDWNVGLDYRTGMWDWNVGLEHLSRSVASSLRASYSLAVPVL